MRWQPAEAKRSEDWSAAATPLSVLPVASKSGVALRFPPQSKSLSFVREVAGLYYGFDFLLYPCPSVFIRG
jgi:hypothetical protein